MRSRQKLIGAILFVLFIVFIFIKMSNDAKALDKNPRFAIARVFSVIKVKEGLNLLYYFSVSGKQYTSADILYLPSGS
jgi:flagellar biogenesis protein FliO